MDAWVLRCALRFSRVAVCAEGWSASLRLVGDVRQLRQVARLPFARSFF